MYANESLGSYRLVRRIGSGAMGEVWEAENEGKAGEQVAVKVVPEFLAHDKLLVERLRREAQAARRLDHPGVVRVIEVSEDDGRIFLVMELLQGETLRERFNRECPLPISELERIAAGLSEALAYIHANGVVHRDLKPDNVWLEPSGRVCLIDLGVAKIMDQASLTVTGSHFGTPAYMSPEAFRDSKSVTASSDIWSLGVMLYEAATGRLPFPGRSAATIIAKIANPNLTPPRLLREDVPEGFAAVIGRCLTRDPRTRSSAADLYGLLTGKRPPDAAAASGRISPRWGLIGATVASAVALLLMRHGGSCIPYWHLIGASFVFALLSTSSAALGRLAPCLGWRTVGAVAAGGLVGEVLASLLRERPRWDGVETTSVLILVTAISAFGAGFGMRAARVRDAGRVLRARVLLGLAACGPPACALALATITVVSLAITNGANLGEPMSGWDSPPAAENALAVAVRGLWLSTRENDELGEAVERAVDTAIGKNQGGSRSAATSSCTTTARVERVPAGNFDREAIETAVAKVVESFQADRGWRLSFNGLLLPPPRIEWKVLYGTSVPLSRAAVPGHYPAGDGPIGLIVADLNDDGHPDVLVANEKTTDVSSLQNLGDGRLVETARYPAGRSVGSLWGGLASRAGPNPDFDLVTTGFDADDVAILPGLPGRRWGAPEILHVPGGPRIAGFDDLDGDSVPELGVVCARTGELVIYRRADGGWGAAEKHPVGASPEEATYVDLDGDGRADVATANSRSNDVGVLLRAPGGRTFQPVRRYPVGERPYSITFGDWNGDQVADLVTANIASDDISVLLGRGDGSFEVERRFSAGQGPRSVAGYRHDLDGDGHFDLAVANMRSNNVTVFFGDGAGRFPRSATVSVGNAPRAIWIDDMDGDGRLDLVTANGGSNDVSVLLGRGDGTFRPASAPPRQRGEAQTHGR